jgi:sulfur-carrier protein
VTTVAVRVPTALRRFSDGRAVVDVVVDVDVEAGVPSVAAVLDALTRTCPGVVEGVLDEQGSLRRHVSVFVGPDNVRDLGGLATPVADGAELTILPAVSGGATPSPLTGASTPASVMRSAAGAPGGSCRG